VPLMTLTTPARRVPQDRLDPARGAAQELPADRTLQRAQ
jgi:hypothetical protein